MRLTTLLPIKRWRLVVAKLSQSENPLVSLPYRAFRRGFRVVANQFPTAHFGWMGTVRTLRWLDGSTLEISGWAFEKGFDFAGEQPRIEAYLRKRGGHRVSASVVEVRPEPLANATAADGLHDYVNTGFRAEFDVSPLLLNATTEPQLWRVQLAVGNRKRMPSGPLWRRMALGSGWLPLPRTFDGVQVLPTMIEGVGVAIGVAKPTVVDETVRVDGRHVEVELRANDVELAAAALVSVQQAVAAQLRPLGDGSYRVSVDVPEIDPDAPDSRTDPADAELGPSPEGRKSVPILDHHFVLTDTSGAKHRLATSLDQSVEHDPPAALPVAYAATDGELYLRDTAVMGFITAVDFVAGTAPGVRLWGRLVGARLDEVELMLHGARAERGCTTVTSNPDGTFEVFASWLSSAWGRPGSPPPVGRYTIRGRLADGTWFRVVAMTDLAVSAPIKAEATDFACTFGTSMGRRVVITVEPRLEPDEQGTYGQRQLRRQYQRSDRPIKEAFYFESFNGNQATCNPFALDADVASRLPDIPRYWGVVNSAVQVPEGAIPVVQGTRAWWDARQSARFVITNEWLKGEFTPSSDQRVLQTWHGTMFKRIGLDRETDIIQRRALLRERAKWDFLLSQNPHSTAVFATAYQWEKEIWEEGYPRNDAVFTKPADPIRELLGIGPHQTAILYAPTWRENRAEMVDFLDLKRLMADLGDDYVLLLRGHSRTMGYGADVYRRGVIDVTSYPNITDLFLAADVLVTDYSSVMFDYSVTGRPMIFFVPDLAQYRDSLRGVYFDLAEQAPGPVLDTQEQVVAAIREMTGSIDTYAGRYRDWQAKYNPYDDGTSARRVIDRLLAHD